LLHRTDGNTGNRDKDNYKNRAVAIIQNEMVDEELLLVAKFCKENKLNDKNWFNKGGSLECNPNFVNLDFDVVPWSNINFLVA